MPPADVAVPRFAAEPPHEDLPYGRWAERLRQVFLAAAAEMDTDGEELGEIGDIDWYPDRTWHGRTFVPATASTSGGFEIFGHVRFTPGADGAEPEDFGATADYTDETAERHPEWTLDLCDEVVGRWRGRSREEAAMTLVWGRALVAGGAVATAELGELTVDQCPVAENRFTLLAPDDIEGELLSVALFGPHGVELARESLYDGEDAGEGDDEDEG